MGDCCYYSIIMYDFIAAGVVYFYLYSSFVCLRFLTSKLLLNLEINVSFTLQLELQSGSEKIFLYDGKIRSRISCLNLYHFEILSFQNKVRIGQSYPVHQPILVVHLKVSSPSILGLHYSSLKCRKFLKNINVSWPPDILSLQLPPKTK